MATTTGRATGGAAVYQQIQQEIRRRIREGEWPAGTFLPSRRTLARQHDVALGTIEKAIAELLADGTLRAQTGRGTFVADSPLSRCGREPEAVPSPQPAASAARLARPALVGVISEFHLLDREREHCWEWNICRSLEQVLSDAGGFSRVVDRAIPRDNWVSTRRAAEDLLNEGVDGLIVVGLAHVQKTANEVLSLPGLRDKPVVYVSDFPLELLGSQISYDNTAAGHRAASHLHVNGFTELTFFAPFDVQWQDGRVTGARGALPQWGRSPKSLQVVRNGVELTGDNRADGAAQMRHWLAQGNPCDGARGIIAANDGLALGILDAAAAAGLDVGRDFGLIGFDDRAAAAQAGLTSLRPPLEQMGREAARLMVQALNGYPNHCRMAIAPNLVARASTRRRQNVE